MNKQITLNEHPAIVVEKMVATDLKEVIAIERDVFTSPWTKEMFYSELFDNPLSSSFTVKQEGQIVGYLFFWNVAGELHLMNIATHRKWQRRGIGEALLKWLFETCQKRGMRGVTLEVRASNFPARLLYQKLGCYEVGIRKNYYYSPLEDAILLACDFH